jgi:two-component system, sensor histidine kinase and response regulator
MPKIDGIELARTIVADPSMGQPVLIMLSSHIERMTPSRMKEIGLSGCELKPIPAARLRTLILRSIGAPERGLKIVRTPEALRFQKALFEKTRILVAEDNPVNQKVALQFLKKAGFTADMVASGRLAIKAVQEHDYELVLMDVQMPDMDGLEATRYIRKAQENMAPGFPADLCIVAMTANAMSGDREICLEAGMDDYVTKPLTPTSLKIILDKYLKPTP